jgi:hypothetical protein
MLAMAQHINAEPREFSSPDAMSERTKDSCTGLNDI